MIKNILLSFGLFLFSSTVFSQHPSLFKHDEVRLLESPFLHAQDLDLAYIMSMDADRLLAPFLEDAGLEPKKSRYGNWEGSGLGGHMGGHYLTALSLAYANTGDEIVQERLNYFVAELKRAQDAHGNGYLGGVAESASLWKEIAKGEIRAEFFSLNEHWVPWYNLHKTYAGLRDAWLLANNNMALDMFKRLGDWTLELTDKLTDEQIQKMLFTEHGGMNEIFADYYAITGDKKYMQLAKKFSENRILDPLLIPEDRLKGLHANTQIPKVVGFARIAQLLNDDKWREAAEFFWQVVSKDRSVAIGGNSVSEHFHSKDDFSSMMENIEGPETCNTYNMLKLSTLLYQHQADTAYVDYYERALYNHILSSQHPQTGGLVYFTPMRPQHYRVYSQPDEAMWCCVGSGIENHLKYGEFIYAHDKDNLYVNLFIPSRLHWREKNVILRQENQIPDSENTRFIIEKGGFFNLKIREPNWLKSNMQIRLNGSLIKTENINGYHSIKRHWRPADKLQVSLPMKTRLEALPDGSSWYAVLHGPVVLSAPVENKAQEQLNFFADDSRMGHQASGRQCPLYDAPMFISDDTNVLDKIKRVPGKELKFIAPDLIGNTTQQLELIPFFRVHDTRYMLYWQMGSKTELKASRKERKEEEKVKLALEAQTIDQVTPGQQQAEVEHNYKGEGAETGLYLGYHWRHARTWFSYELNNPELDARILRVRFNAVDSGRTFDILLNGVVLDTVISDGSAGQIFFDKDYELPKAVRKTKIIEVKLQAAPGSMTGDIFDVRLLK